MNKALFLFVCIMCISFPAFAQEAPAIDISLIVVPEKQACKPDGYAAYASGERSDCSPLTIDEIENWKILSDYIYIERDIPPIELSLGNRLFRLLDAYRTASKKTSDDRKSIVIIFDWKSPQTADVKFTRKLINRADELPFPEMQWEGRLERERRWIHHERADAFLPAHKVVWILESGGHKWVIKTAR